MQGVPLLRNTTPLHVFTDASDENKREDYMSMSSKGVIYVLFHFKESIQDKSVLFATDKTMVINSFKKQRGTMSGTHGK